MKPALNAGAALGIGIDLTVYHSTTGTLLRNQDLAGEGFLNDFSAGIGDYSWGGGYDVNGNVVVKSKSISYGLYGIGLGSRWRTDTRFRK